LPRPWLALFHAKDRWKVHKLLKRVLSPIAPNAHERGSETMAPPQNPDNGGLSIPLKDPLCQRNPKKAASLFGLH